MPTLVAIDLEQSVHNFLLVLQFGQFSFYPDVGSPKEYASCSRCSTSRANCVMQSHQQGPQRLILQGPGLRCHLL
jgi:hypothetical protein